jgi:hypothetical protein
MLTSPTSGPRWQARGALVAALPFLAAAFGSYALVFLIQPILGRIVLVHFGGTDTTWNSVMLLIAGAALAAPVYAYLLVRACSLRRQFGIHLLMIALPALFWLAGVNWSALMDLPMSASPGETLPRLFLCLGVVAGWPTLAAAANAVLLQKWFVASGHPAARSPYFLYAAANLGGLGALLAYPTLSQSLPLRAVDPATGRILLSQPVAWDIGYGVVACLLLGCVAQLLSWTRRRPSYVLDCEPWEVEQSKPPAEIPGNPTLLRRVRWAVLAAVPMWLLADATTSLPATSDPQTALELSLLTLVVAFAHVPAGGPLPPSGLAFLRGFHWGVRSLLVGATLAAVALLPEAVPPGLLFLWLLAAASVLLLPYRLWLFVQPVAALALVLALLGPEDFAPAWLPVGIFLLAFAATAMVFHGAMARDRPDPRYLTEYYVWLALGPVALGLLHVPLTWLSVRAELVDYPLAVVLAGALVWPRWLGLSRT